MEVIGTPREDHHLCNKEVMGSSSAAVMLNDTNRQADCRIHAALDRQASKSCQQAPTVQGSVLCTEPCTWPEHLTHLPKLQRLLVSLIASPTIFEMVGGLLAMQGCGTLANRTWGTQVL